MADRTYTFGETAVQRIADAVRQIEGMSQSDTPFSRRGVSREPNIQYLKVTSTTATSSLYPATVQSLQADGQVWTSGLVVWLAFPNSSTPILNMVYGAKLVGARAADDLYIFEALQDGGMVGGGAGAFVGCKMTNGGLTHTIATSTSVDAQFGTEEYDTDGFHSGSDTTKIIIPTGLAGKYRVGATVTFSNTFFAPANWGRISILKNAGTNVAQASGMLHIGLGGASTTALALCVVGDMNMSVADYFQVNCFQTSGNTLDLSPIAFWAQMLG